LRYLFPAAIVLGSVLALVLRFARQQFANLGTRFNGSPRVL